MKSTRLILIAVSLLTTVVLISATLFLWENGKDVGDTASSQIAALESDMTDSYKYLDGVILTGSELKTYYWDTHNDVVWSITTNATKETGGTFNVIDPRLNTTSPEYIADDGKFLCNVGIGDDGKIMISAVQQ